MQFPQQLRQLIFPLVLGTASAAQPVLAQDNTGPLFPPSIIDSTPQAPNLSLPQPSPSDIRSLFVPVPKKNLPLGFPTLARQFTKTAPEAASSPSSSTQDYRTQAIQAIEKLAKTAGVQLGKIDENESLIMPLRTLADTIEKKYGTEASYDQPLSVQPFDSRLLQLARIERALGLPVLGRISAPLSSPIIFNEITISLRAAIQEITNREEALGPLVPVEPSN